MQALSITENETLKKVNEFLDNECLKDVVQENGFPVQIQIPVGVMVKGTITFGQLIYLNKLKQGWDYKELF